MAKQTGSKRVWAVRMSASWIDIRHGPTKPERVVTYLTGGGLRGQNVCHVGGRSACSLSIRKYHLKAQEFGLRVPAVYGVVEIPGGIGKLFLDSKWRRRNGL